MQCKINIVAYAYSKKMYVIKHKLLEGIFF